MKTRTKVWLIIAVSFILIGCLIFGGMMTVLNWDFTKLSSSKTETNDYVLTEKFENISISINTADIMFVESNDDNIRVECIEDANEKHTVKLEDNTLDISYKSTKKWYHYIGFDFTVPKITVYIPAGDYGVLTIDSNTGDVHIPDVFSFSSIDVSLSTGNVYNYSSSNGDVKIKTSTGHITIDKINADSLDLSVSTGCIKVSDVTATGDINIKVSTGDSYLTDITCKNLISKGNTGDLCLNNVIATEKYDIIRTTGDVTLDSCDADEINIKTDTGDVEGTLLSDKIYSVNTSTGNVNVPRATTGGICEITTSTGDITISVND